MWNYNREDDTSRYGREGPNNFAALAKILVELFKGEEEEFLSMNHRDGCFMCSPPSWVSSKPIIPFNLLPESLLMNINPSICNRNGEISLRGYTAPPHSQRTTTGTLTLGSRRIRIYSWCSRTGCFTKRATTARKWPPPPTTPFFFLPPT